MLRRFLTAAACGLALMAFCSRANAADISWGSAQDISGDSDVSTTGTLVGAVSFGGPGTTVNGVTFEPLAITSFSSGTDTVGNFSLSSSFFIGAGSPGDPHPPFSSLSSGYQSLLGNDAVALAAMTLTMSDLTIGQTYQFQTWVNDSTNNDTAFPVDVTGGSNTVTLSPDASGVEGGLGQFAIGTFTADSTSQDVTFFNSEVTIANGFQLRAISSTTTGPSGVPLPPAVWSGLALLAVAGVAGRRLKLAALR